MKFLPLIILFIAFFIVSVINFELAQLIFFSPIKVLFNLFRDLFFYFKHKNWRLAKDYIGKITIFQGLFGKGKTLFTTMIIRRYFKKYDGKKVWDPRFNKWVTQKVYVYSNVEFLDIPYVHTDTLQTIIDVSEQQIIQDKQYNIRGVNIFFYDELGAELNSRNFKTNLGADIINVLLQCRKHNIALLGCSQRFLLIDKLLRDCTADVIDCHKKWRFGLYSVYDGFELENATNVLMIKPKSKHCMFVTNKDYAAYDTYSTAKHLVKEAKEGKMLSEAEILANRGVVQTDLSACSHLTSKGLKRQKK